MLEVESIPLTERAWPRILLFIALAAGLCMAVVTENSFWLGASLTGFIGWLIAQGNRNAHWRAILLAAIIGLLAGCAIDSITLGTSVLTRSFDNFSLTNLIGYMLTILYGAALGFCERE